MELPGLPARVTMRRFILPPASFAGLQATVTGEPFRHMATVLRLEAGSRLRWASR